MELILKQELVKNYVKKENTTIVTTDRFVQNSFNYKVYKHNDFINSKSNFSAMEHRIILLALVQIKQTDEKLKMYKIQIGDVLGKKNYNHYETVRKSIRRLHQSTIEMEEEDGWKSYAFITKAQGKYKESFIEVQFHEDIQKFLLGLKTQYTTYTLENVMKFKKNNSLRIYELCKQYCKIGNRIIDLFYLKTLLSLENKYKEFRTFKDSILKPCLEEINKNSDIQVDFLENREGKKVKSLKFFIQKKKNIEIQTLEEASVINGNDYKLISAGFNDSEVDYLRKKYKEQRLSEVLELFEKNIEEVKFPKAWIEKALEENYVDNTAYKTQLDKKEEEGKSRLQKMKEMKILKREILDIEEQIYELKIDIEYYKETGHLKSGDVMRFPLDYEIEDAIEELESRVSGYTENMEKKKELCEKLEKELL